MFICLTCRIITDITSQYGGETVHVCGADCFGIAVEISNHDCSKYQEQAYTPEGILFSKCIVCDEAAEQGLHLTYGIRRGCLSTPTHTQVKQPLGRPLANGGIVEEIVGAMIGTIITNNPADIIRGLENNTVTRLLSKQEMQFMASCDLGRNWEVMASSRVLFCLDDDGKPFPASLPNKACSRRVPRRGAKVVKSKSKVMVGRTRG